jgi:hypothetical protein
MMSLLLSGVLMTVNPTLSCTAPPPQPNQRVELSKRDILPFAGIGLLIGGCLIFLLRDRTLR